MAQCVSVVIPVYYNEDNIAPTWSALSAALAELPGDLTFEVIFVDDGSGDASYARLESLHRREPGHVRRSGRRLLPEGTPITLRRDLGRTGGTE